MTGMMSRMPSLFEQTSADARFCATQPYAQPEFRARVVNVTRQSTCFVRSSSHNDTPSFDGQLASPSARLPVLFWRGAAQGREPDGRFGVVHVNNVSKGLTSWVIPNLFLHWLRLRVCLPAATLWANKRLAAALSAQVRRPSPAVASLRVPPSVLRATLLPVRQIWSIATDLTIGLRPNTILQHKHHAGSRPRGVLRFTNLFHHHKGPAYV